MDQWSAVLSITSQRGHSTGGFLGVGVIQLPDDSSAKGPEIIDVLEE
jgi:hypothetical protein